MVTRAEPAPGEYSRAVVAEIQQVMASARMSANRLGPLIGRSNNYVSMRLRNESSFTLTDIEEIGKVLSFDPAEFLGSIKEPEAPRVTYMHRGIDLMSIPLEHLKGAASTMEDSVHLTTGFRADMP